MRKTRADERGGGSIGALAVLLVLGAVAVVGILGNRKDAEAAVDLTTLTASSTHTTITTAPLDSHPFAATDGLVVHPRAETALYSAPDGEPFAKIGTTQFGATWLPVVEPVRRLGPGAAPVETEPVDRLAARRGPGPGLLGVPDPRAHRVAHDRAVRAGQESGHVEGRCRCEEDADSAGPDLPARLDHRSQAVGVADRAAVGCAQSRLSTRTVADLVRSRSTAGRGRTSSERRSAPAACGCRRPRSPSCSACHSGRSF